VSNKRNSKFFRQFLDRLVHDGVEIIPLDIHVLAPKRGKSCFSFSAPLVRADPFATKIRGDTMQPRSDMGRRSRGCVYERFETLLSNVFRFGRIPKKTTACAVDHARIAVENFLKGFGIGPRGGASQG
jgi:hypothetical protein